MLRKGFNGAVPELQLNHRSAPQARAWGREQWGCTRCQAHPCPLLAVPCGLGRSGRRALHRAMLVLRMGTGSGIPCMRLRSAGGQWGCPVEICAEGSHLEPPPAQRSVWGHLLWCWGCTVPLITPGCCWRSGRVPQAMSRGGAGAASLPAGPGPSKGRSCCCSPCHGEQDLWGAHQGPSGQWVLGLLLAGPQIAACSLCLAGEPGALRSSILSWE